MRTAALLHTPWSSSVIARRATSTSSRSVDVVRRAAPDIEPSRPSSASTTPQLGGISPAVLPDTLEAIADHHGADTTRYLSAVATSPTWRRRQL